MVESEGSAETKVVTRLDNEGKGIYSTRYGQKFPYTTIFFGTSRKLRGMTGVHAQYLQHPQSTSPTPRKQSRGHLLYYRR